MLLIADLPESARRLRRNVTTATLKALQNFKGSDQHRWITLFEAVGLRLSDEQLMYVSLESSGL